MFSKILIANRGEIACRVMATARQMGVRTVAVYSDADAGAQHVRLADETVRIGPAPVAESYLLGDRIIAVALATGAQAIHPGYGFLSENPGFVRAVEAAGLVFIGPTAEAIDAMGLKDAAKKLMVEAGVPVVPGYHGDAQDAQTLAAEAAKIGYPVLIKARAGGGGKGMRLVETAEGFEDALAAAQREGQSSFGDPHCLIEKYITQPRHIEIQVFGDSHGNVVHFFERDCSLQRRHQKVIEEAPAPDMPASVRDAMGKAAVDAAKAIGYIGAGTVEFILDGANGLRPDGFWFMEMNTRLQVEHPVSEAITGWDFVELQLRVAAGEALPMGQQDLSINGWSFEARLYAEDVPKGFLPATGTVDRLRFPQGVAFELGDLRVDSGIVEGDTISPFYDPMIAKVIVHGPTRDIALARLMAALQATQIDGTVTNISFLTALSQDEKFAAGKVSTDLIADRLDRLTATVAPSNPIVAAACVAASGMLAQLSGDPWAKLNDYRHWGDTARDVTLGYGEDEIEATVIKRGATAFCVVIDGTEINLGVTRGEASQVMITPEGAAGRRVDLVLSPSSVLIYDQGEKFVFSRPDPANSEGSSAAGGDTITAPMPGMVIEVAIAAGDAVKAGQVVMILEAMKMEHKLTAPRDGTVKEVFASAGDQVSDQTHLVVLEPQDD